MEARPTPAQASPLQRLVERNPWRDRPYPPPPGIPAERGSITIASLRDIDEPVRLMEAVDRWARSTWLAFAPLLAVIPAIVVFAVIPFGSAGDASMTIETTIRLVRLVAWSRLGPHYFIPVGGHAWRGCLGYVRAALEGLRAKGLLISAAEFLTGAAPCEPAEIGLIGVPTRGGATLERCVTGYAAHTRERGRAVRFLLAGDIAPEAAPPELRGELW